METCGSWTKKCGKESGKSQEETAEFLNVALRTYQYCESGERTFLEHQLERRRIYTSENAWAYVKKIVKENFPKHLYWYTVQNSAIPVIKAMIGLRNIQNLSFDQTDKAIEVFHDCIDLWLKHAGEARLLVHEKEKAEQEARKISWR